MHALGTHTQHTCLQATQGPGSPNLRTTLPRWSVPLRLQRPVCAVASVGSAAVLAAARPGTLPSEAALVLALPSEPGCLFGRVAFGRAGHGHTEFRRNNFATRPPYGK